MNRITIICLAFLVSACAEFQNPSQQQWLFKRSLNRAAHGFSQIATDNALGSLGFDRFEVRSGDCFANTGWSDCENDRERSEVSSQTFDLENEEWIYEWSIFLEKDFPDLYPAKTTLGQFHQRNSRPSFMFNFRNGGYWIHKNIAPAGDPVLLFGKDSLGRWNTIRAHAKWSRTDGSFFLYVNERLAYQFHGQNYTGDGVFFKYGIYRSFLKRYFSATGLESPPSQIVLYSGVSKCQIYSANSSCYAARVIK